MEGLNRAAESLKEALEHDGSAGDRAREGLDHFIRHHRFRALSRELITELIERIEVSEGQKITIEFRYRDELEELIQSESNSEIR